MNETPLDPSYSNPTTHERPRCWENDDTGRQVAIAWNDSNSKSRGDEPGDAARIIAFETNCGSKPSGAAELVRKSSYNVTRLESYKWFARQISYAVFCLKKTKNINMSPNTN